MALFLNKIQLEKFSILLREDGIFQIDIKPFTEVTVDDIKEGVEAANQLGRSHHNRLMFVAGEYSFPTLDAQSFLASKESVPYAIADAFVMKTSNQDAIEEFYLKVHQPARETRFFSQVEDAITWLNSIIK
jgi:hypothetical protein